MNEVLVQMARVFRCSVVQGTTDAEIVDHRDVLYVFAQPDTACVRTDRNVTDGSKEQNGQDLVETTETTGIDLAVINCLSLQQLFEDQAIGGMFTGCDANWSNSPPDCRMAEDVVRMSGFLDPAQLRCAKFIGPIDGLSNVPHLVCIGHQLALIADLLAHHLASTAVGDHVDTHFCLETGPPGCHRLSAQATHLLFGVAEPASGRDVGGIAIATQGVETIRETGTTTPQELTRTVFIDLIAEVAKVDAIDELIRLEVRNQPPHRNPLLLAPEVPHCVDQCCRRKVNDPLVGSEPAQLGVIRDRTPERPHCIGDPSERAPDHELAQRLDGAATQVVAPADRERHPVTRMGAIGVQDDIRRRVVGVGMIRIGAVQEPRGASSQVVSGEMRDRGHGIPRSSSAYRRGAKGRKMEQRVVVISGSSGGIGSAMVERFESLGDLVEPIDIDLGVDISDPSQCERAVAEIAARHGRIDVLCNNAGVSAVGDVVESSPEDWQRVFDVNVFGTANLSRAALPLMRSRRTGAIVNTCSIVATVGLVQRAVYAASKGAVLALTKAMAADEVGYGIRVNCVSPGTVESPWVQRLVASSADPGRSYENLRRRQPLGSLVSCESVAEAVAYLASSTTFTTGADLLIDGGISGIRIVESS